MSVEGAIATNRFGLGAKPGEIAAASADPKGWLKAQLVPVAIKPLPGKTLVTSHGILVEVDAYRAVTRQKPEEARAERRRLGRQRTNRILREEIESRTRHGVETDAPFHERLTRFWSNHFTVSTRDRDVALIAGAYEREAIRPRILGRFEDLVLGAVLHQAMLVYLDNIRSVGPNSRRAQRGDAGLNENLAREVLELHTVSPASGYTQADIEAFARVLTGWTVGKTRHGEAHHGRAFFNPRLHEPGSQHILGKDYPQEGAEQAIAVIRDLCAHPATARHVALKLASHFVSDAPPTSLVDQLTRVFIDTGGDLKAVYLSLIDAPEAWQAAPMKVKTPDELITSTARLIGLRRTLMDRPGQVLAGFGQETFQASSPEGWPDEAMAWMGPDAMLKRVEWANRLAERSPELDARRLLKEALGDRVSEKTVASVAAAESGEQALVLALMSPDFQRR